MSRIGIIIGSTRDKAAGKEVGEWIYDLAQGRKDGVEYTLLDLKEFDIPVLTTEVVPAAACQMRVFGTGVLGTRYCRVPGSWYRAEGYVGPGR